MIIGLCETWLNLANESLFNLNGYICHFKSHDRSSGGGVGLMISSSFAYYDCFDLADNFAMSAEATVIKLSSQMLCNTSKLIICETYRPPSSSIQDFITEPNKFLTSVSSENPVVYILGDLNINLLKFLANKNSLESINTLLMHGDCPLINKPTRVTGSSVSTIDYIIAYDLKVLE